MATRGTKTTTTRRRATTTRRGENAGIGEAVQTFATGFLSMIGGAMQIALQYPQQFQQSLNRSSRQLLQMVGAPATTGRGRGGGNVIRLTPAALAAAGSHPPGRKSPAKRGRGAAKRAGAGGRGRRTGNGASSQAGGGATPAAAE